MSKVFPRVPAVGPLVLPRIGCGPASCVRIVGTDVNVPNELNRSPRTVRLPPEVFWNCTIPRFPAVSGRWSGRANDVWPDPETAIVWEPSREPVSSQIVAVIFAERPEKFASATSVTNPAVLSYGRISEEGNWISSGTVPSEGEPDWGVN